MAIPAATELTGIVIQPAHVTVSAAPATLSAKPAGSPSTASTLTSLKPEEQEQTKSCCRQNFSIVDVPFFSGEGISIAAIGYGLAMKTTVIAYGGGFVGALFGLSHIALRYYQRRANLAAAAQKLELSDQKLEDATKVASEDIKEGKSLENDLEKDRTATNTQIESLKKEQTGWLQREKTLTAEIVQLQANVKSIQESDQAGKAANVKLTSDLVSMQTLLTQYKTFLGPFNTQFQSFLAASQKAQAEGGQIEAIDFKLDHTVQQMGTSLDAEASQVSDQLLAARDLRDQFVKFSTNFTTILQGKIKELQTQVQGFQEAESKMKTDTDKLGQIVERETKLFADQESLQKEREQLLKQKEENLKLLQEAQAALSELQTKRAADASLTTTVDTLSSALDRYTKSTQAETDELDKLLKGDEL